MSVQANAQNFSQQTPNAVSKNTFYVGAPVPLLVSIARVARAAYRYAMKGNNVKHIFGQKAVKHNLAGVIAKFGSKKALIKAVTKELAKRLKTGKMELNNNKFNEIMRLRGYNVTATGKVVGGVPKLGTLFVPRQ